MSGELRAAAEAALMALLESDPLGRAGTIEKLRAALAEPDADWDRVAALEASLREHMAEIHRLRAALAEAVHANDTSAGHVKNPAGNEQVAEPVAWMVYTEDGKSVYVTDNPADIKVEQRALPLYTHPPRREWVGLTDEERRGIREHQRLIEELGPVWSPMLLYYYLAIEAALKEKNHDTR